MKKIWYGEDDKYKIKLKKAARLHEISYFLDDKKVIIIFLSHIYFQSGMKSE